MAKMALTQLNNKAIYFLSLALLMACTSAPVWSSLKRKPNSMVGPETLGPETTSILIWNTFKGQRPDFENDAKEIIDAHDIILFQEVVFNDFYQELLEDSARLTIERSISWGKHGVATSSITPSHQTLPIRTKVREFGIFTRKASLFTTYKIQTPTGESRNLLVLNVHMINFRTSWGFQKNLELYRDKLQKHQGPILAAGDFNTWSDSRRKIVLEFFREFGLREVQFDWDNYRSPPPKSIFGVLDRAFVRGLDVHWARVYEDIRSSDHQPFALGVSTTP